MTSNIRNLPSIVEIGDGYKKWSDGTLEQWGRVSMPAQANTVSVAVSFAKPFANPSYSFLLTAGRNVASSHMFSEANSAGNSARTINGTAIVWSKSAHAYATEVSWYAIGKWT